MGKKLRKSGGYIIHRLEELFKQSDAMGKPDYEYVALAIGSMPGSPPSWAMLECIKLRQQLEQRAARGIDDDIAAILDGIVRFYDQKQQDFELQSEGNQDALDTYIVPPLRAAILEVLAGMGLRQERAASGNDDWFRDIREAWDWEQENDPAPAGYLALAGSFKKSDNELVPIVTTSRVYRVLMQSVAKENGDPEDVHLWTWIAKHLIEEQTKRGKRISPRATDSD